MERVAKSFNLQTVVNPETAEETQRIVVVTTMGEEIRLYLPEMSVSEAVDHIKADKSAAIKSTKFKLGDFGWFAYFSNVVKSEEI